MYSEHPVFIDPEEKNLKLWRFMDFTKFVSMLSNKSLFFCKANCLDDNWEGSYPKREIDYFYKMYEVIYKNKDENTHSKILKHIDEMKAIIEQEKGEHYINCWHFNDTESAAMWKLYLKSNEGIVIKSNFNSLKKSFKDISASVYIGKVHYINYEDTFYYPSGNTSNAGLNLFRAFIHKRKSYFHENEYRAIVTSHEPNFNYEKGKNGIYIPVNLDTLIDEVTVAPNSTDWFFDLVKKMLKMFGINKEVKKSILDSPPFR